MLDAARAAGRSVARARGAPEALSTGDGSEVDGDDDEVSEGGSRRNTPEAPAAVAQSKACSLEMRPLGSGRLHVRFMAASL